MGNGKRADRADVVEPETCFFSGFRDFPKPGVPWARPVLHDGWAGKVADRAGKVSWKERKVAERYFPPAVRLDAGGHFVPCTPVKIASCLLLVDSSPLFEKESDVLARTLVPDLANPLRLHGACSRS